MLSWIASLLLQLLLAVHPPAYGARLLLALAAHGPLPLPPASSKLPDGACQPFAAAYIDGAQSASLRVRAALANRALPIRRV